MLCERSQDNIVYKYYLRENLKTPKQSGHPFIEWEFISPDFIQLCNRVISLKIIFSTSSIGSINIFFIRIFYILQNLLYVIIYSSARRQFCRFSHMQGRTAKIFSKIYFSVFISCYKIADIIRSARTHSLYIQYHERSSKFFLFSIKKHNLFIIYL